MGDMTALERQLAARLELIAGPEPRVDAMASARSAMTIAATNSKRWGFTMFSALKFVAAGVIVALFGGFLLAGVLTTQQDGEMAPAAVTASPERAVTSEPTEAPDPSIRTDILPGVALTVEEVEPGVFRVIDDGISDFAYPVDWDHDHDIVAGDDGGIYFLEPDTFAVLGEGEHAPRDRDWHWFAADVEVAPDGTLWGVSDTWGRHIVSFDRAGGDVTRHLPTTDGPDPIEVTSDGTVWAVWRDDSGTVFGYLGVDGPTMVGEWPFDGSFDNGYLRVSDRGDVWAVTHVYWGFFKAHRFVDGAWREGEGSGFDNGDMPADVGVDGTLWGIGGDGRLVRFDGTEWTTFWPPDWSRIDIAMRELAEDGWVPHYLDRSQWGEPHVAPDGSLWVPSRLGVLEGDPDRGGGHRVVCGHGLDGVAHFDGETWSRFLQGHCVEGMDIAADGSVWMLAGKSDARFPLAHLYVITPEAMAATE